MQLIWLLARLLDMLAILAAAVLAYLLRFDSSILSIPQFYWYPVVISLLLAAIIFPLLHLYDYSWRGRNWLAHIRAIFVAWMMVLMILALCFVAFKVAANYSRIWLFYWFFFAFIFLVSYRFMVYLILMSLRDKGYNRKNVIIVGAGLLGRSMLQRISQSRWTGYNIAMILDDKQTLNEKEIGEVPVYTDLDNILQHIDDKGIDEIWITLPLGAEKKIETLISRLDNSTVNIKLIPDGFGLTLLNHSIQEIAGVPALDLRASPVQGWKGGLKSLEDKLFSIIILILMSPVMLLIALAIKLTSPGPVLYKQKRHGWDGKTIKVYKFRTMIEHAEAQDKLTQAVKGDVRVTRIGRILRKTSLDELPQFYNVLQGRMSIVGPRPHAIVHNEFYKNRISQYMLRHKVKPGITGWAQIHGYRGETDTIEKMQKRLEFDLYYIQNWSLGLDLWIILMTILKGFINKNSY